MKIWAFPIPACGSGNQTHKRLAALGQDCSKAAKEFLENAPVKLREGSLGRLRTFIREKLTKQLREIDGLARSILVVGEQDIEG